MTRTRRLRTPLLALALALFLAACGGTEEAPSDAGTPATAEATSEESQDQPTDQPESVSVDHAMGTTEVPCAPERVVTLGQGQTDSTLALGVEPVGVVEPWTDEFYAYLPEAVHDAEVVGNELEPDLEAIAALQPDLILGSKLRHEAVYDQLSQIAPTVFAETIGRTWKENVSLWAEALCRQDEGEKVLRAWDERTTEFAAAMEQLGEVETSIIRFMPDEVRIYLTGFPGTVFRDAGLERPEAQRVEDWETSEQLISISQERIPEMDGDVIFVMVSDWTQGEALELQEEWTSHPLWEQLTAVQNDAVFGVDEEHWNLGGGILAANAMLDDLEEHFLQEGGARSALEGRSGS